MNVQLQLEVKPMEEFVVGGNMVALKRKEDATAVTVLDSKDLEKIPVITLDEVFRGWVPGTNNFDVGDEPEGFPTLSIRGASGANALSTISVYVDGIEYAGGSGYLFQLDKNNIDRVEVVRGPGAATMFGTGSNGGVVHIFTKKPRPGETSIRLTTSAGFYKSKWVAHDPFQQAHNLEAVTGYNNVTLTMGASYRTVNEYLPGGGEKNKSFYASTNFKLGKLQANVIGRFYQRTFSYSRDPSYDTATHPRTDIIIEPIPGVITTAYEWLGVKPTSPRNKNGLTQTGITGINLSHSTTKAWTNSIQAGYTMNSTEELPVLDGTTPLHPQYFSNRNYTTTIRYSNVLKIDQLSKSIATVIISGAEYKRYSTSRAYNRGTAAASLIDQDPDNKNYGAFIQATTSYKNVYLTTGIRYENNNLFDAAWNPRFGLTTNFETRQLTFKPKVSWGRGITAPAYHDKFGRPSNMFRVLYGNPDIKPQSQQGFDYGLEAYHVNGRYGFEITYYNNVIRNMIGQVSLSVDSTQGNLPAFMSTNVAAVANYGWEFSGEYRTKRFNLMGTLSIMHATVKDTTGLSEIPSLQGKGPGTQLINLPKHTAGLNVTYHFFKLFSKSDKGNISLSVTEVDGVKNVDNVTYLLDVAYGRIPYQSGVFSYPSENSSVFRLGLNANYSLRSNLNFFVQGTNILNDYEFEYSSNYPTHGATWLFGFKYNFTKAGD